MTTAPMTTAPRATSWPCRSPVITYDLDGIVLSRARLRTSDLEQECGPAEPGGISVQHCRSGSARIDVRRDELHLTPDRIAIHTLGPNYAQPAGPLAAGRADRDRDRHHRPAPVCAAPTASRRTGPSSCFPSTADEGRCSPRHWRRSGTAPHAGRVAQPAAVAAGFVGLVNGLLDHAVDTVSLEPLEAMERHLRERLADSTIGTDDLRRAFSYSRSTIYRAFERHGGVAAFIRAERLRCCYEELSRPAREPVAVSQVAGRFGFHDASQFSRAFRARYGITPSQLVAISTDGRRSWHERPAAHVRTRPPRQRGEALGAGSRPAPSRPRASGHRMGPAIPLGLATARPLAGPSGGGWRGATGAVGSRRWDVTTRESGRQAESEKERSRIFVVSPGRGWRSGGGQATQGAVPVPRLIRRSGRQLPAGAR